MTGSPVGPGTEARKALRAWVDAQPPPPPPKPRQTADERRVNYNQRQRTVMKKRRNTPEIRERERKANKARDTTYRRLAAAFPEDYLRILNDERIAQGLPRLVPRKVRSVTNTTVVKNIPEDIAETMDERERTGRKSQADSGRASDAGRGSGEPQDVPQDEAAAAPAPITVIEESKSHGVDPATCKHNGGLNKFTYGKFCKLCGKMIR